MPEYRLTRLADADIVGIWQYTYQTWGKQQADRYLRQLERRFIDLAQNPAKGSPREELFSSCRIYPEGKHLIFYRSSDNGIEVVRVLHERMNVPQYFSDSTTEGE